MSKKIPAIPTTYKGARFRSMLEAKWAAFFDGLGWQWTYEPFELGGWIPDFVVIGKSQDFLVELKPFSLKEFTKKCDLDKIVRGVRGTHCEGKPILLCGHSLYIEDLPFLITVDSDLVECGWTTDLEVYKVCTTALFSPDSTLKRLARGLVIDNDLFPYFDGYEILSEGLIKGTPILSALKANREESILEEFNTAGAVVQWNRKEEQV